MKALPWAGLALVVVAFFAGCGDDDHDEDGQVSAPTKVSLLAGLNDDQDSTIAVTEFLPESISVTAGTTVEWRISGPEPHSVTFLPTGQEPPAGFDRSLFAPTPPTAAFDGTKLVNSGLAPTGPEAFQPFEVAFSTPGDYRYFCVVHPLMTGTVKVVAGGEADSQLDINARADDELARWLKEGRAAKEKLEETPPPATPNPDGSTNWKIAMGTTTEHTDILAFSPDAAEIRPGDSITFVNDSLSPHTATFAGGVPAPVDRESPEAQNAAPGPSPQTLAPQGLFNTGLIPPKAPPGSGPPEAVRSYTYVIPRAGTYNYVCVFHLPSDMTGSVKVA